MRENLRKLDLTNKEILIGLDIHTNTWHATIQNGAVIIPKAFTADVDKFALNIKSQFGGANIRVAYEAGCFGFWIKEKLDSYGISTELYNPADIPSNNKDRCNKTDASDSRKILSAMNDSRIKAIYAPDHEAQEHRDLTRRNYDVTKKITGIKNQLKAKLKFHGVAYPEEFKLSTRHWSKNFITWLKSLEFGTMQEKYVISSYINELEFLKNEKIMVLRQIKLLAKEPRYSGKMKILSFVPGIGLVSGMLILTEIIDMRRFLARDQYLCYLGLSPNEHSSGKSRKIGHITRRCNHRLRTIFIEAAWIAIRKDSALADYYNREYKRIGKQKAIIKVAKKLAVRVRYVLLNNVEYELGVVA